MSPLRQRMIEDTRIRRFGPKPQHDYVRVVVRVIRWPPVVAGDEASELGVHLF